MTKRDQFEGCIIGGAIGDAFGSGYENQNLNEEKEDVYYLFGHPLKKTRAIPEWQITDDTQLTLATIESIMEDEGLNPESIAQSFLKLYRKKKLKGLGSSTLKALQELEFGGHWSQVGRKGEYAAGNGAAMRIAPLAFCEGVSKATIRDICSITHKNDEAYVGAMSIIIAIREILEGNWTGSENLISLIIGQIPDTKIRDRLMEIESVENLFEIGKLGNSGYVVNSVPLAIAAANRVKKIGIEEMYLQLIKIGGDTDTNCSLAGQIAGTLIGRKKIPEKLINKLSELKEFDWIEETLKKMRKKKKW